MILKMSEGDLSFLIAFDDNEKINTNNMKTNKKGNNSIFTTSFRIINGEDSTPTVITFKFLRRKYKSVIPPNMARTKAKYSIIVYSKYLFT